MIKSADDLNEQKRQSEVLIKAIEKCEKLEEEIIALKKEYQAECNRADELEDSLQKSWQNESKLKKQLDIAIKTLESLRTKKTVIDKVTGDVYYIWDYALAQIKELDK